MYFTATLGGVLLWPTESIRSGFLLLNICVKSQPKRLAKSDLFNVGLPKLYIDFIGQIDYSTKPGCIDAVGQ